MIRAFRILFIGIVFLLIIACQGTATPAATSPVILSPSPLPTGTATSTSTPGVTPTTTASPFNTNPQTIVLVDHLSNPDDLLLAPDGSIYLSDVGDGTVKRYTSAGGLQLVHSGLAVPEGMVILPDGSLIIAEQGKNRLVRYNLDTQTLTPFLDLTNTTGQEGVDGLAWDPYSQSIILPDSPNGSVLRVTPDGKTVTKIASGFARPTGAWVESDGSILVVDENGNSLSRIHPDGTVEKLAVLSIPDDVIEDKTGNILVVTLGDNAIHLISKNTGQDNILPVRVIGPQGIIFSADGNLVVTDSGNHRLIELVTH